MPALSSVIPTRRAAVGAYPCRIKSESLAESLYGSNEISERHRHRWEVNNEYRVTFEENGMQMSGTSPDGRLVEIIEIPAHPFFIAAQFHPELKSRPNRPHPLFFGLVKAAQAYAENHSSGEQLSA